VEQVVAAFHGRVAAGIGGQVGGVEVEPVASTVPWSPISPSAILTMLRWGGAAPAEGLPPNLA
jgi:hypothetical protein